MYILVFLFFGEGDLVCFLYFMFWGFSSFLFYVKNKLLEVFWELVFGKVDDKFIKGI